MAKYEVIGRIKGLSKKEPEIGSVITLDESEAFDLVRCGALKPVPSEGDDLDQDAGASLSDLTVKQLKAIAEEHDITLEQSANKAAIVAAIEAALDDDALAAAIAGATQPAGQE